MTSLAQQAAPKAAQQAATTTATTPATTPVSAQLLDQFIAIVSPANAYQDDAEVEPFVVEWRGLYRGKTPLVLAPGSVEEVSKILALANKHRIAIVPQGGNTGLVGGQVPDDSGLEIVLSLKRLNAIRSVDPAGGTIVAEAGVILQTLQEAADDVDRLFPLSLSSEGSCTVGGVLSSNAGGTAVLAYGNARDLVLGLEVVLADGTLWQGLRSLHKDNTGYDLKHLFIGAEGTLGVITAATLKLFPKPKAKAVALVATLSVEAAVNLLNRMKGRAGANLTAFELMSDMVMQMAFHHVDGARNPLSESYPFYCLIEVSLGDAEAQAEDALTDVLEAAFEAGEAVDAVIAQSMAQADDIWSLRHHLSEVQKFEGGSIKHDVSVPIGQVAELVARGTELAQQVSPGCRPAPFGHLGDGNLHFNISQPIGVEAEDFLSLWGDMNAAIHGLVTELGGSISAEHGIGRLKRDLLPSVKPAIELDLMHRVKQAFDPNCILNPGRVL